MVREGRERRCDVRARTIGFLASIALQFGHQFINNRAIPSGLLSVFGIRWQLSRRAGHAQQQELASP